MAGLVLTGAHLVLQVNGRTIGRVVGIRWSRKSQVRRAQGIDQLVASELIRTGTVVQGSVTILRTRRDGGAEGAGLVPPIPDQDREQYVSLTLRDRTTDTVVMQVDEALVESEGWTVAPRGLLQAEVAFEGLTVNNEVRPQKA
jgi:hypothetical protein